MSVTVTIQQWQKAERLAADLARADATVVAPARLSGDEEHRTRVRNVVLGAAIGDALGHPTEFISSYSALRERYGPEGVTGYELYWERGGRRFAPYTDDTQLAEAVLRSLVWSRLTGADLDATMEQLGQRFVVWAFNPQGGHRAPGNATLAGCRLLSEGVPWREAGALDAGGCGSVMRAYPFGLVFWDDLERAETWAVEHSRLTHGAPLALAACAGMAVGISRLLRGDSWPQALQAIVPACARWDTATARMVSKAQQDAECGVPPERALDRLRGWAAHEALAAAVYVVTRHGADFRAAALEGANAPGDSDSIATLAGALSACLTGESAIPREWIDDLERHDELEALAEMAFRVGWVPK